MFHSHYDKTVGSLALSAPEKGKVVSGVLMVKDFNHLIMSPSDLSSFTQLTTSSVVQSLVIPFHQGFKHLMHSLEQMYEHVEEVPKQDKRTMTVSSSL